MKASVARNAMANSRRASCTETAVVPYPKPSVLRLAAVAVDVENVRVGPCRGGAEVARADLDDPGGHGPTYTDVPADQDQYYSSR
jgi:hypothetical protein